MWGPIMDGNVAAKRRFATCVDSVSSLRGVTVLSPESSDEKTLSAAIAAGNISGIVVRQEGKWAKMARLYGLAIHWGVAAWTALEDDVVPPKDAVSMVAWGRVGAMTSVRAKEVVAMAMRHGLIPVFAYWMLPPRKLDLLRPRYSALSCFDAVFPLLPQFETRQGPESWIEREFFRLHKVGIGAHRIYPTYLPSLRATVDDSLRFRSECERRGTWGWGIESIPKWSSGGRVVGEAAVAKARHVDVR